MSHTEETTEPRFLPEVEEALRRAGWYPGRVVEEETMQKWYAFRRECAPGYNLIFPAAYRFLREFGGLKLNDYDDCIIDPLATVGMWEDLVILEEWQLETRFYPLGVSNGDGLIHIDLQGRFWSFMGHELLGYNTEEALSNLVIMGRLQSHPPKKIERKPIDPETEELIERIVSVEKKVTFFQPAPGSPAWMEEREICQDDISAPDPQFS